ncbi:3-dehydroquinate synthase homolog isoform X3 [Panicum virgatum]|uniref:3-dehydroquinate synthase n=1 Tax=Panicum virgatum TaxID=38727 RepID=A0A8T0N4W4_PANVG|nr:3-dehydroquinate synthase homolog isoform X3 [Panicum virgatum]KAG2543129.1 hypothetical protein PVAP13_9NG729800 [Panicum virgatum]
MAVSSSSSGSANALACFHASLLAPQTRRTAVASASPRRDSVRMRASTAAPVELKKTVWVWTENRQVMKAAVERGWSTFLFGSKDLGEDWSSTARINPLFIDGPEIFDGENQKVAEISQVSSPRELELVQPDNVEVKNIVIDFRGGWQVIPAENIVAAFQGCRGTVLAVSTNSTEAQVFLEDYFDRRNEAKSQLPLTKATVSKVEVVGMGDRVCVDLCSMMRPGEGLLVCVGSYARGMFLVHSECLETNYIASRPFRVNAGPVHAYVTVPGGKTSYLSELRSGKEIIVVDQHGLWRTAIVGRVKIESRPLVLVEAKDNSGDDTYSIFLQNAETVALITDDTGSSGRTAIPVTSLTVGDEVLVRKQGGARHTGIEIQEFIVEK